MNCPACFVLTAALAAMLVSCKRSEVAPVPPDDLTEEKTSPVASVAPEPVPRCRSEGARLPLLGEDVIVGEAAIVNGSLLVGVIRRDGAKRVASIVVTDAGLTSPRYVDVGVALGDDPPPVPYAAGGRAFIVYFARKFGESTRELRVARLDLRPGTQSTHALETIAIVPQQADESLAFDVAWGPAIGGATPSALVAWDEDAPRAPGRLFASRGLIKVQFAPFAKAGAKAKVVSPEDSDAELPRLLPRRDGYWLAWLANRPEVDDAGAPSAVSEGPGESRAYRWVEIVALDAKGDPASNVRRVSSEKGRALAFDLATPASGKSEIVVLVQDEAASAEGGGARITRYVLDGDRVESGDIVDSGVGAALAELVPAVDGVTRWLSWVDTRDRARIVPLGPALAPAAPATFEPSLDEARPLIFAAPNATIVVANQRIQNSDSDVALAPRTELARILCH
ncbi:MAG: hypothetical protein FWD69_03115 [Polyangiaceae bacterium]|nr:hypothetical protein [Polyangiaceae bacterium]